MLFIVFFSGLTEEAAAARFSSSISAFADILADVAPLLEVTERAADPADRLRGVLEAYAQMVNDAAKHHGTDLSAVIHRPDRITHTEHRLHQLVQELIADASSAGSVRSDVAAGELATYCLNALMAAGRLPSKAAVRRLVLVTLSGLRA